MKVIVGVSLKTIEYFILVFKILFYLLPQKKSTILINSQ